MDILPFAPEFGINTAFSWISSLAFSPDGSILAGGGAQPNMGVLWDTSTGQEILTLPPHVAPVTALAFSPDGTIIACASGNFDLRSVTTLVSGREPFTSIAFSADGMFLAGGAFARQNGVRLWDMTTRSPAEPLDNRASDIYSLAFGPDGKTLIGGLGDNHDKTGAVLMWDVITGQVCRTLFSNIESYDGRDGVIYAVAGTKDGRTVAAGGGDGAIFLWITE